MNLIKQTDGHSCAPVAIYNLRLILGEELRPSDLKVITKRMGTDKDGTTDAAIEKEMCKISEEFGVRISLHFFEDSPIIKNHLRYDKGLVLLSHRELCPDPESHISLLLPVFEVEDYELVYPAVNFYGKDGEVVEGLSLFEVSSAILSSQVESRFKPVDYYTYLIHTQGMEDEL